jgi:hypothetical protein
MSGDQHLEFDIKLISVLQCAIDPGLAELLPANSICRRRNCRMPHPCLLREWESDFGLRAETAQRRRGAIDAQV